MFLMAEERAQRRLAAILAADVVNYSRLMAADEAGALAALKERRKRILDPLLAQYQGRIVKVMGDGVLVEFASAVNAVQCAVELQQAMAVTNEGRPADRQIVLRIGVNLGDVMVEGGDLYGEGVNIAARLEALADPGGILVSGTAYDHVSNKVKVGFEDIGAQTLKNIAQPVRAYRVTGMPAVTVPAPKVALDKPAVAVLPFTNMSGDTEQEYFSDGITEDIITELSRFHSLLVIARNSSFAFKGRPLKVQEIGRELGVAYVVEGSVRRLGDRLRLTAQLIESASGSHIWAERYDRDVHDIFNIQDELAHAIAATIGAKVEAVGRENAAKLSPSALKAHDLVLRAKAHALKYTRNDLEQARQMARYAIELDPTSAQAPACYAFCCSVIIYSNWTSDRDQLRVEAFDAAKRAVALDVTDNYARWVLGMVYLTRREYEEARIHLEKVVENNPNDTEGRGIFAMLLVAIGEAGAAIEHFEIMKRQNPFDLSWFPWIKGLAYFTLRRYGMAIATFKQMPEPHNEVRGYLAACHAYLGKSAEAKAMLEEFLRVAERDMLVFPGHRLTDWDDYWRNTCWYKRQEDHDHLMDGLRKAGLPE
jgi:adenylate cyclase